MDTACLSEAADRAKPEDRLVSQQLQNLCGSPSQLFNELRVAKSDVSWLSTAQLLIKDLKVAAGIPIAGLPIKVQVIYLFVHFKYYRSMLLIYWGQ